MVFLIILTFCTISVVASLLTRCLFQSSLEKSYRQTIHNLEDTSRRQEDMLKEMMQRLTNINTDPKSVGTEALDNRKYMLKSRKV